MIPSVFTAVFALFPLRLHVRATAIAGSLAMLAPTLGPTLGGYITDADTKQGKGQSTARVSAKFRKTGLTHPAHPTR